MRPLQKVRNYCNSSAVHSFGVYVAKYEVGTMHRDNIQCEVTT